VRCCFVDGRCTASGKTGRDVTKLGCDFLSPGFVTSGSFGPRGARGSFGRASKRRRSRSRRFPENGFRWGEPSHDFFFFLPMHAGRRYLTQGGFHCSSTGGRDRKRSTSTSGSARPDRGTRARFLNTAGKQGLAKLKAGAAEEDRRRMSAERRTAYLLRGDGRRPACGRRPVPDDDAVQLNTPHRPEAERNRGQPAAGNVDPLEDTGAAWRATRSRRWTSHQRRHSVAAPRRLRRRGRCELGDFAAASAIAGAVQPKNGTTNLQPAADVKR